MDKSTFSILFIMQKGKPNAQGNAPIFARITVNHQMTHLATHYYLPPDRWLPKEGRTLGRTKEEKEVNAYLDNLRGLIFSKYNEMFLSGETEVLGAYTRCLRILLLYDLLNLGR